MLEDESKINAIYNNYEENRANGFLFLFSLWVFAINPLLILYNFNPTISTLRKIASELSLDWMVPLLHISWVLMILLVVASAIFGRMLFKLKKIAWKLTKIYFSLLLLLSFFLNIPSYILVQKVYDAGVYILNEKTLISHQSLYVFKFITSFILYFLSLFYLYTSKKGKKAVFENKKK